MPLGFQGISFLKMRPKSICCLSIPSSFHRVYYTPFFLCITALPWRAFRKLPYVSCDDSFGFPFIKRRTQHLGFNHQLCGLCSSGVGGKLIIIHNLCKLHVISLCVCVSVTSSGLRHLSCFFFQYKRRGVYRKREIVNRRRRQSMASEFDWALVALVICRVSS